jgi:hypothetical protein
VRLDQGLEQDVLETMDPMRDFIRRDNAPGPRGLGAKCRACEFYTLCWVLNVRFCWPNSLGANHIRSSQLIIDVQACQSTVGREHRRLQTVLPCDDKSFSER